MSILLKRSAAALVMGLMALGVFAVPALAADKGKNPAVIGTVSAINGTTITVTSKVRAKGEGFASTTSPTVTTYTVNNAANATITKNNATSTFSAIAIGDTVMVQGTVSGTTVTATAIRDGVAKMMGKGPGDNANGPKDQQPNLVIQGNGQPVVGGTITAISGSTLTIKNTGNVTYTVDALNAVIVKGNATSTLSSIAVGDAVVIQGAVTGTSITATTVIDQSAPKVPGNSASTTPEHRGGGFFKTIGGFFSRLFGFF